MKILQLALTVLLFTAGCGNTPSGDQDMTTPGDMAMAAKKAFGDTCTGDADCDSNMCRGFMMMTVMKCTKMCTTATQATDCPNPPSQGTCTNQNYCRF